jgi:hypothetical protein
MINTMSCTPSEAISAINALWPLKLSVMLWGCPYRKFRLVEEEPIR